MVAYCEFMAPEDVEVNAVTFLWDIPDVEVGVISNLQSIAPFAKNPMSLFFCLEEPTTNKSWRIRKEISKQHRLCAGIYDPSLLFAAADLI
jgi:hypothetical protein